MIKVLHLLSDPKFADIHIARFCDPDFENRFVCLMDDFQYRGPNEGVLEWVVPFSPAFHNLKNISASFDAVIVYRLDYVKACFINEMAEGPRIFWHFYGTEIYNDYAPFKYSIYSKKTRSVLRITALTIFWGRMKRILSRTKHYLLKVRPSYDELQRAISKINFFLWYAENEYNYLQQGLAFPLPPFLQLSVLVRDQSGDLLKKDSSGSIWLGNSASPENNHIDVIELLLENAFAGKIILPFSYGGQPHYKNYIKTAKWGSHFSITLLEEFIDYDRFSQMLVDCDAAIFNSYRQMALGNIFIALRYGVKVYLNEQNPSFWWLKNNGFHLYSVQHDLRGDIMQNRFKLLPYVQELNRLAYEKLVSIANNRLFLDSVKAVIENKKNIPA